MHIHTFYVTCHQQDAHWVTLTFDLAFRSVIR